MLFVPFHDFTTGSNVTPLATAIKQMQISRRHTMACDPRNKAKAPTLNLTVLVSPLQNKRRHTLTTAAILNSARKAVDQAQKVAEQHRRRSIAQMEGPKGGSAVPKGAEKRTPLKSINARACESENENRAASTPEGNVHLMF